MLDLKFFIKVVSIFLIHHSVCAQDFSAARSMCTNYGFVPNTPPFAQCVQTEINKKYSEDRDEKQNQACKQQRKEIESRANSCGLSCFGRRDLTSYERLACSDECDKQLDLRPVCR